MDKNAIKKYAVWARRELISRVSQRAALYGITEKDAGDANATSVNGHVLSETEKKQRQALIGQIRSKGYEQVMEEVAYTWFNRFSALRFMEVNGYLPSHVRVFTDDENAFKPQILTEAINLEIDGIDMEKVYALKNANDNDELFKYLIIVQCNALSEILPGMFQRIADYTELLFPDNLLREGSAVEQMIALIPQDDWQDQVQIIGWLYQYYNSEKKDDVFAALKNNVKITKENIPAATQLFTPDWIVRYMVENSLGRLWLEGHPSDELKSEWKYYLDEAEQEPQVKSQLATIRKDYATLTPEQIKCIDPCSGSGHICAYMFDVLMQIYEAYGYTAREAVASIVENNIYGLDIDERAAQLAYFAVMMKARQYDRRFFSRGIQPHIYAIQESNTLDSYAVEYFCDGRPELKKVMETLRDELYDAKEYGSILQVSRVDFEALYNRISEIKEDISIYKDAALVQLVPFINSAEILSQKYHAVVTNPPYMGGRNMNAKLLDRIVRDFPEGKADLFSAFILRTIQMTRTDGFQAMITMHSWMFLSSFEQLRNKALQNNMVVLNHLGARAFEEISGEVVQTASWVLRNSNVPNFIGRYVRLINYDSQDSKERAYLSKTAPLYSVKQNQFDDIPGQAFAYWLENPHVFTDGELLEHVANPRQGLKTLNNDYYIRFWYEVDRNKMYLSAKSLEDAMESKRKWFPLNHGGEFRKYYGNNFTVVNWENDGSDMKANAIRKYKCITRTITNIAYYFKSGITWSVLCSAPSFRWFGNGFIFSNGGQCIVPDSDVDLFYLTGLMNSKITGYLLNMLSPTLGFESGYLKKLPVIHSPENQEKARQLAIDNVSLSKEEWDAYEISWDFKRHPLVDGHTHIRDSFIAWEQSAIKRFEQVRANEEALNSIFISVYGLNNSLSADVDDKDISLRVANKAYDIKSFISYAVGCMFGRYSLTEPGLIYAGGVFDREKYSGYRVDEDNIIPICDDEYFEDDIVGRFVEFVKAVYGSDTLEENLKYIADALGGKGQPRDVIRNYFMNEFYTDHVRTYQKCPIYWQFDSGKKGGFKALIYMHRYQPDTIARIRTDYVHEQQSRYRTAIADLQNRIANASTSERVNLTKKLKTLQDQAEEIRVYEEKIHHLADQMIKIDLDDGVKVNYAKFQDVLAKIK